MPCVNEGHVFYSGKGVQGPFKHQGRGNFDMFNPPFGVIEEGTNQIGPSISSTWNAVGLHHR